LASPEFAMVDNIVVKQGCRMQKLKYHGQRDVVALLISAKSGGQNHEEGAQPLAATIHYIAAHPRNQGNVRVYQVPYFFFDPHQIRTDLGVNLLLEVSRTGWHEVGKGGNVHYENPQFVNENLPLFPVFIGPAA
jgi:hypothetical protein